MSSSPRGNLFAFLNRAAVRNACNVFAFLARTSNCFSFTAKQICINTIFASHKPAFPSNLLQANPRPVSRFLTSAAGIPFVPRALTCEPRLSRCNPTATFQLSPSSMMKTYFLPSGSRIEARRRCLPFRSPV